MKIPRGGLWAVFVVLFLTVPGNASAEACAERRLTDASSRHDNRNNRGFNYPRFLKSGDAVVFNGTESDDDGLFRHDVIGLAGGTPRFYAEAKWSWQLYRDDPAIHEGQCTEVLCVNYVEKSPGLYDLAVMDRKTGKMSSVSVGSGDHRVPVITPDGKRIVFIYNPAGHDSSYSLMVVGIDGSDPKVLVAGENPNQTIWLPAISPDGKLVAYSKGNYARGGVNGTPYMKSDIFVLCLP